MRRFILIACAVAIVATVAEAGPLRGLLFRRGACPGGVCEPAPPAFLAPAYALPSPAPAPLPAAEPSPAPGHDAPAAESHVAQGVKEQPSPGPTKDATDDDAKFNFGVDWSKIGPHSIEYNGRKITCDTALERIGGQIPNDANKFRMVCIGSKAECDAVKSAWAAVEQSLRDQVSPWYVAPDHWSLKDTVSGELRYKVDGHPTIYLLAADGKSIHRQDGFTGAQDFEAIRKGVKGYDPTKDVDLRKTPTKPDKKKTSPTDPDTNDGVPLGIVALGALALVLFTLTRRQQP